MEKKGTIFITGCGPNGITGPRIKDYFDRGGEYNILAPSSRELDLTDADAVDRYFDENEIDYVIHCAVIYPQKDNHEDFYLNIKMFFNLISHKSDFKKMFYFGSGAEYDKRNDIVNISEDEIGHNIPVDTYGLSKFIMNQAAAQTENVYNIRLFGTLNPNERPIKNVVSNLCYKVTRGLPVQLRCDCRFSFTDIDDVVRFIDYAIVNDLQHHDYNFVPSGNCLLSEIGNKILKLADKEESVSFQNAGLNKEYTASNSRLIKEFADFTSLDESLIKIYQYVKEIPDLSAEDVDGRWK